MNYSGKRVVVMGLGRFGGGVGATKHLAHHGSHVLVTDLLPADQLHESLDKLSGLPVEFCLGQHRVRDFTEADLIVVNPAVDRRNNQYLRAASTAGVKLTSEIQLTIQLLPNRSRTIGVTGTAGKSTVTAMISHILSRVLGKHCVYTGGNLGGSLLDNMAQISADSWIVMELSSFMLEDLNEDHWSPHIAVVTNLAANHLDRHSSVEDYATAKQVILEHQHQSDHAILGPKLEKWLCPKAGHVDWIVDKPHPVAALKIPGSHNQLNADLAIQTTVCAGVERPQAVEALATFSGLPHRMQFICQHRNIRYFNDSKATTPEAAQLAIASFNSKQTPGKSVPTVHVILGGYDKGTDLEPLGRFAGKTCRSIFTIGATGDAIADAAEGYAAEVMRCETLARAVDQACLLACTDGVVLLSPGCASWDQFDNYEQRGANFTQLVLSHRDQQPD